MTSAPPQSQLARMRAGVCLLFACFGMTLATWAVHLPSVQRATGMSTAMVGTILLISGVGALLGMQVCGPLADRLGGSTVGLATGAAMAITVMAPLVATTTASVAAGAFVFGAATGSADVAMNAAAVETERAYGRPIMASFHAIFSLGSVAGSLLATVGFAFEQPTVVACGAVVIVVLLILGGGSGWLRNSGLSRRYADSGAAEQASTGQPGKSGHRLKVIVLGTLAFLLLLSEGAAMDWSSLHAQQHFGVQPAAGAIAFGSFVTAMTVSRFCADRLAGRIGPVAMVRWGCVVATGGIALVVVAPAIPVALVGWMLFGLGLAGGTPQVFTAAGNIGGSSGRNLATVVGIGYVAIMAGPGLIGWLAELSSINTALLLPLSAIAVCAVAAPAVGRRR